MFVTGLLIYFVATTGAQLGPIVLGATVLVDLMILGTINNIAEAWATNDTNPDQPWDNEE